MECRVNVINMPQRNIHYTSDATRFNSVDDFLSFDGPLRGLIEISHGLPIHLYFRNRNSDVTFVSFAAALGVKRVRELPFFGGMSTSSHLHANSILISDPSLILSHRLGLGWYAGSCLQEDLQRTLTIILKKLTRNSRVVFFGASGGGYAALEQAVHFESSTVLASNPQVDIRKSPSFKNYAKIAWGSSQEDIVNPPIVYQVLDDYSQPTSVRVVYLQNLGDAVHVDKHWRPFTASSHPSNKVLSLTPMLGKGHVGPDKQSFRKLFSTVTETPNWQKLCAKLNALEVTRNGV